MKLKIKESPLPTTLEIQNDQPLGWCPKLFDFLNRDYPEDNNNWQNMKRLVSKCPYKCECLIYWRTLINQPFKKRKTKKS